MEDGTALLTLSINTCTQCVQTADDGLRVYLDDDPLRPIVTSYTSGGACAFHGCRIVWGPRVFSQHLNSAYMAQYMEILRVLRCV